MDNADHDNTSHCQGSALQEINKRLKAILEGQAALAAVPKRDELFIFKQPGYFDRVVVSLPAVNYRQFTETQTAGLPISIMVD